MKETLSACGVIAFVLVGVVRLTGVSADITVQEITFASALLIVSAILLSAYVICTYIEAFQNALNHSKEL